MEAEATLVVALPGEVIVDTGRYDSLRILDLSAVHRNGFWCSKHPALRGEHLHVLQQRAHVLPDKGKYFHNRQKAQGLHLAQMT